MRLFGTMQSRLLGTFGLVIVLLGSVVGVALTAQSTVPGCATGVTNAWDADVAMRFCIEVAKSFGQGALPFVDTAIWRDVQARYGTLAHLQTVGREVAAAA